MNQRKVFLAATLAACLGSQVTEATLVASVLPTSRSVQVGETATAFAAIINASATTATNCGLAPGTAVDAVFAARLTNPANNAPIVPLVERADIPPNGVQTYVFGFTPNSAFAPVNVQIIFDCDNTEPASVGLVNTLQLSASATPVPDIIALAATLASDGVVRSPGTAATGVFSVATANVGAGGLMTITPLVTGGASAAAFVCQTDPASGACISAIGASVQTNIAALATPTFGIFVAASGRTNFDPANVRVTLSIADAGGVSRGATSVAFETQTDLALGGGTLLFPGAAVTANPSTAIQPIDIDVTDEPSPPAAVPTGFGAVDVSKKVTVSDTTRLDAPLTMVFDFDDAVVPEDSVTVLHYNALTGSYEPTTMLAVDAIANKVTFDSRNFSSFVITSIDAVLPAAFNVTGYSTANQAWNIKNFGSYFAPGGNCLGMSGYANWFFTNHAGNLNDAFPTTGGEPISIAHLAATRAHLAQSQYWADIQMRDLNALSPALVGRLLKASLVLFDEPLILLLDSSSASHATVVYGYDANGFKIYEVSSAPGATRDFTIPFDGQTFGVYDGYNIFTFVAMPSLGRSQDFAELTAEAQNGFATSADLQITSPVADETLSTRDVKLTGSLVGALAGGRDVIAYVNGEATPIGTATTAFDTTIPVKAGANTLIVLAGDFARQNRWSKNAATRVLTYTGNISEALFRATLTWNKASDVDLYVTEPTGQTAWYGDHDTSSGLELDFDNTSGFGPENVTLAGDDDDVLLEGFYDIRVHHYAGSPPVSGQVQILLFEGDSNQVNQTINWTINAAGDQEGGPGTVTPAWTNIANVDVVNETIVPD